MSGRVKGWQFPGVRDEEGTLREDRVGGRDCIFLFFLKKLSFYIEVQLINNVSAVSGGQQKGLSHTASILPNAPPIQAAP